MCYLKRSTGPKRREVAEVKMKMTVQQFGLSLMLIGLPLLLAEVRGEETPADFWLG